MASWCMWCSLNWCKWCPLNSCMWCTLNRCMWCTFISVCGACLCLYDYVSWYGLTDEEIDPILGRENTRYNPPTPSLPPSPPPTTALFISPSPFTYWNPFNAYIHNPKNTSFPPPQKKRQIPASYCFGRKSDIPDEESVSFWCNEN